MSFESASNPEDARWDADNSSGNSVSGDEASLTGLFQHAFAAVAPSSSSMVSDEDFPFDEFESNVMTACMLSAADTVQLPVDFEDQVMARIKQEATPQQAAAPRSFRSPLLRHTSRELYLRYRKVVQVVFPIAAAASIVLAIYVNENKTEVNRGTFGPESIQNIIGSESTTVKPDVNMAVPPATPNNAIQQDEQQKEKAVKHKKKVKARGPAIITGE